MEICFHIVVGAISALLSSPLLDWCIHVSAVLDVLDSQLDASENYSRSGAVPPRMVWEAAFSPEVCQ